MTGVHGRRADRGDVRVNRRFLEIEYHHADDGVNLASALV